MDNNLRYFKTKLIKITYIDYNNRKLTGFLFSNKYIKKNERIKQARKYLNENIKTIVDYKKVDGFIPIDVTYINRIDLDYHI